jgi:Flp pilus assembly protein TadG
VSVARRKWLLSADIRRKDQTGAVRPIQEIKNESSRGIGIEKGRIQAPRNEHFSHYPVLEVNMNWCSTQARRSLVQSRVAFRTQKEQVIGEANRRLSYVGAVTRWEKRRGMAAVELAFLLPLIVFIAMATVDFARVMYVLVSLQNCARNGALYEFYTKASIQLPSGWTSLSAAVQADEGNLTLSTPTATSPQSSTNNSVTVSVSCTFSPIAFPALHGLPSIPGTITLTQSSTMPYPASAAPTEAVAVVKSGSLKVDGLPRQRDENSRDDTAPCRSG